MGGVREPLADFYIQVEARMGNREEVEREIQDLFERTRNDKWVFPDSEATAATAYTLLGDIERALPTLARCSGEAERSRSLTPASLRLDPSWDRIRNDSRFQKLCQEKPK